MARRKKYCPEQIVKLFWQIDAAVSNGKRLNDACSEAGIIEQTYDGIRNMEACARIRPGA